MTIVIFFDSLVEICGGDHGCSCREEEVRSVLERCPLNVADEDVLVSVRSHGLVHMANLAMAGGLPFCS